MYHEKQSRRLCGLHTLNNLFQNPNAFSQAQLESIAKELDPESFVNPHKSPLGLGNYDVNVLTVALKKMNHELVWFDKRQKIEDLNLENVVGFIFNVPSTYTLGFRIPFYKPKHWYPIIKFEFNQEDEASNGYYNLDSYLDEPKFIGDVEKLCDYLREEIKSENKYLFIVVTDEVYERKDWIRS